MWGAAACGQVAWGDIVTAIIPVPPPAPTVLAGNPKFTFWPLTPEEWAERLRRRGLDPDEETLLVLMG